MDKQERYPAAFQQLHTQQHKYGPQTLRAMSLPAATVTQCTGAPEDHYLIPPIYIGAFDLFFYLKDEAAVQNELRKVLAKKVCCKFSSCAAGLSLCAHTLSHSIPIAFPAPDLC